MAKNLDKLTKIIQTIDSEKEVAKNPKERKLKRVEDILRLVSDGITQEEFIDSFGKVLDIVKAIKTQNIEDKKALEQIFIELKDDNNLSLKDVEAKIAEKLKESLKVQQDGMNFIRDKVRKLQDGRDGKDGLDGEKGERGDKGENGKSINESIIEKLRKEVEDKIKDLEKRTKTAFSSQGRVQTPRYVHVPMLDRLTAFTDGATKEFTLSKAPKETTTMEVLGTDFPIILDPTVDFIVSGRTLTLTDAVPAPTSGATLIVKYYV